MGRRQVREMQGGPLTLEKYHRFFVDPWDTRLTIDHLNHIIFMHGFVKLHRYHKDRIMDHLVGQVDLQPPPFPGAPMIPRHPPPGPPPLWSSPTVPPSYPAPCWGARSVLPPPPQHVPWGWPPPPPPHWACIGSPTAPALQQPPPMQLHQPPSPMLLHQLLDNLTRSRT